MNDKKRSKTGAAGGLMSSETSEHPSSQQGTKESSKQKQYPKEDKTKTARQEHTNGSTPKSRL